MQTSLVNQGFGGLFFLAYLGFSPFVTSFQHFPLTFWQFCLAWNHLTCQSSKEAVAFCSPSYVWTVSTLKLANFIHCRLPFNGNLCSSYCLTVVTFQCFWVFFFLKFCPELITVICGMVMPKVLCCEKAEVSLQLPDCGFLDSSFTSSNPPIRCPQSSLSKMQIMSKPFLD